MNGSPPTMPKKTLPIDLASRTSLWNASGWMISCLWATSTQQPWQRRLQELMIETYKNGGKYSPFLRRDLCFWTESIPLRPMFQASFQSRRLSVSNRARLAIANSMGMFHSTGFGPRVGIALPTCLSGRKRLTDGSLRSL